MGLSTNMSSCLGFRKSKGQDTEPLLPQYHDDTVLQRELHQKLHSYQMIRALTKGYMPSNEQAIINLRTLSAADILNPDNEDLSDSGRLLVRYTKLFLKQFMEMLQHKNSEDQIQDLIWYLSKSRVSVDVDDIAERASKAKAKADTAAAYQSLRTVGSLLLTNSDFRVFLSDITTIGREVFKDAAFKLSDVAEEAGKQIEPSQTEQDALKKPGADDRPAPTSNELAGDVADMSKAVGNGALEVAKEAEQSLEDKITGDEKETLLYRLKQAVTKLRRRNDYSDSVSTISLLIKRYAMVYSRAIKDTAETADQDIHTNPATERAVKNFWLFLKSFGDGKQWDKLEERFLQLKEHGENDPQFEDMMMHLGNSLEELLTDPSFFDNADEKFAELREKTRLLGKESSLRDDVDAFLGAIQATIQSVLYDEDIAKLIKTSTTIAKILSPAHQYTNTELIKDSIHVFVPLLIQAVQYLPIPRLEISTPEIDLLLENLILEPGRTINHTSFLPYKLRIETYNDLEIRKARFRTTTKTTSLVTIKIDGLSLRSEEVGFWLRAHTGILRFADEGITSFELDERGIDIHLDVEIAKEKLEQILTLKDVRVHVHKLNYKLRKSKLSWLAWLFKPLLRPVVRKVMEKQLATAIADGLHAANRELLFARERLRATRISDPKDVMTFFKAVAARLTPEEDPDLYSRVGVAQPGKGVFKGVYAPGSVVKLWNDEAAHAEERVLDYEQGGWRNDIFDVHTTFMT
ncbi:bactericidal permeability-increasing protein [Pseudovirgaria hyperparasitica]|uniref:Bactericidal permeability-increasing protein n=1 Tax=Pseudovirgaria hyperparasitica TaxID=470096 RepID=A0A6A6VV79_9PEZI|nr:bactericidal permeability-increasing protein [Pseudovirgaria hyperparasitica]KAF2753779.1 bactericidal permeability-increasing protein [Pseudovirgaria hyperparasitica]